MIKKRILSFICLILAGLIFGCHIMDAKKKEVIRDIKLSLIDNGSEITRQFGNLDYGLRIQVNSNVDYNSYVDLKELPTKEAKDFPRVELSESLIMSTEQNLNRYATALGFDVGGNFDTDYILNVRIRECNLKVRAYNPKRNEFRSSAAVMITWELLDADRHVVISSTTTTGHASANSQRSIASPLAEAYFKALKGIDWNRIASKLKIGRTASQEKNKQVSGSGNTSLEHTVIRWYIISKPQGADVTWRVVSSTPDVANTNGNYVGTTPYESTESFDIRGLTYNNSGNVQIEVTCEKPGYVPQKKRFNLRQAIDQKEISAKFSLVKEDVENE